MLFVPTGGSAGIVQLNTPLCALSVAPAGSGLTELKVSVCAGKSVSVAWALIMMFCPICAITLLIGSRVGAEFTSLTPTVKVIVLLGVPPGSLTRTGTLQSRGPSGSPGVHVNKPVLGLIAAPGGGETRA